LGPLHRRDCSRTYTAQTLFLSPRLARYCSFLASLGSCYSTLSSGSSIITYGAFGKNIFKSDLNQKFNFNFNSCFKFILKEDLRTVLVSVYKAAVEKAINYQLINCYFIFFTFNQQNLQNLATKEQI
jgi:hypothetical protein